MNIRAIVLFVVAASAVLVLTLYVFLRTTSKITYLSEAESKQELCSVLGLPELDALAVSAAVKLGNKTKRDGWQIDQNERWWYRFEVPPKTIDTYVSQLKQAWRNRSPQKMEGDEFRVQTKYRPTYILLDGDEAIKIFKFDFGDRAIPEWWRPGELRDLRIVIFADTDVQFSGLSPPELFYRFQLAYSATNGICLLREFRPYTKFPINTAKTPVTVHKRE